jgi:hypothetical protein
MPIMTNNEQPRTGPAPADQDWFGGRRWTGIAAIGFVILVVLCVVVVLAVNHGNKKNTGTGTPAAPATSAAGAASSPASALPTTVPSTAPPDVTWSIYETVALPSRPGSGPAKVNGALATGYAHSPLGALLAVANVSYRFALADGTQWRAVANATLAPGPGKNAWIRLRNSQPFTPTVSGDYSQIAGFQFSSYSVADAVIQLVTRDSKGTYQVGAQHVVWSGADWLLVLPPSGVGTTQVTPSLLGFIPWGGV